MSHELVVVVSGGKPPRPSAGGSFAPGVPVVAADRGLEHARALGLEVTTVVGDMDSVSPDALAWARARGARIDTYPEDKDATDLELALDAALELVPERILVLTGDGGRLDHLLATALVLGSPRYAEVAIDAEIGDSSAHVVRGERVLSGAPGKLVSLLPLHGPAEGVTTAGLRYPLVAETLGSGSTRGISNVFLADSASVRIERGVLLAVIPGEERDERRETVVGERRQAPL
jgi:thiamine pyrophosphokinase